MQRSRSIYAGLLLERGDCHLETGVQPVFPLQVLISRMKESPISNKTPPAIFRPTCSTAKRTEYPPTRTIVRILMNFTRQVMQRCSSQFRIMGPKVSLASNQRCQRSEERAKQAADKSTKGVVGSNGKTMPRVPSPRNTNPNQRKRFTNQRTLLNRLETRYLQFFAI